MPTEEYCPTCGASMKKAWHTLTPGLVGALVKIYKEVSSKGENVWVRRGNDLTKNEDSNLTKLRFHGLIARVKKDGERVPGEWLITRRGVDFLRGEIQIPRRVQTFRNRVIDHDEQLVTVTDVMKGETWWEQKFDYSIFEPTQGKLI
jgi:hypothetical protein